jgi:hypothetical protein
MISFNISAIDIILAITIAILAVLYLKRFQELFPEKLSYRSIAKDVESKSSHNVTPTTFSIFEEVGELGSDDLIHEESL